MIRSGLTDLISGKLRLPWAQSCSLARLRVEVGNFVTWNYFYVHTNTFNYYGIFFLFSFSHPWSHLGCPVVEKHQKMYSTTLTWSETIYKWPLEVLLSFSQSLSFTWCVFHFIWWTSVELGESASRFFISNVKTWVVENSTNVLLTWTVGAGNQRCCYQGVKIFLLSMFVKDCWWL